MFFGNYHKNLDLLKTLFLILLNFIQKEPFNEECRDILTIISLLKSTTINISNSDGPVEIIRFLSEVKKFVTQTKNFYEWN